jgi:hypothetical protein
MLKIRLGHQGSGKTNGSLEDMVAERRGRTSFIISPCYEGGTTIKDGLLIPGAIPTLNFSRGFDWKHLLPLIKGKIVRVRIDENLPVFLEHLQGLSDFQLTLDDFKTIGEYPGVRRVLKSLFSLCRYRCDIYITAHFYFESFGTGLSIWRSGADSLKLYGPAYDEKEAKALMLKYHGVNKVQFYEQILNNPKFHPLEIIQ